MTSAYENLMAEEARVGQEVQSLNQELDDLRNKKLEQQIKLDKAILGGAQKTITHEGELERIHSEIHRKEHRLKVLSQSFEGNQFFVDLAQKALGELHNNARDLNKRYKELVAQLEDAFFVYLRAVGRFKALEHEDSRLRSKIDHCQSLMPRGTGLTYVEGVPERTTTNLKLPGGVDALRGIIWMVAKREGLMAIRDAYENARTRGAEISQG